MILKKAINQFAFRHGFLLAFAFFFGLLDSVINVLLLLSIGKYYALVNHDQSIKGGIFDLIISGINDTQGFYIFFVALIVLKVVSWYLDSFLNPLCGERFAAMVRNHAYLYFLRSPISGSFNAMPRFANRMQSDFGTIKQLMSKGVIEAVADLFYLVLLFVLFLWLDSRMAMYALAAIVMLFLIGFVASKYIESARKSWSDERLKFTDFLAGRIDAFFSLKLFSRESAEWMKYQKMDAKVQQKNSAFLRSKALLDAAIPATFYGLIFLMLVRMGKDHIVSPNSISFILVIVYAQSPARRLTRVPTVWRLGRQALSKWPSQIFDQRSIEKPQDEVEPTALVRLYITSRIDSNPAQEIDLLPSTLVWARYARVSDEQQLIKALCSEPSVLFNFSCTDAEGTVLSKEILNRSVAYVSARSPLFGKNVFEAISPSRSDAAWQKAVAVIAEVFGVDIPESERFLKLSIEAFTSSKGELGLTMLGLAKARLFKRKRIIVWQPYQHLERSERLIFVDLVHKLKKKNAVIVFSDVIPEGVLIDKNIVI